MACLLPPLIPTLLPQWMTKKILFLISSDRAWPRLPQEDCLSPWRGSRMVPALKNTTGKVGAKILALIKGRHTLLAIKCWWRTQVSAEHYGDTAWIIYACHPDMIHYHIAGLRYLLVKLPLSHRNWKLNLLDQKQPLILRWSNEGQTLQIWSRLICISNNRLTNNRQLVGNNAHDNYLNHWLRFIAVFQCFFCFVFLQLSDEYWAIFHEWRDSVSCNRRHHSKFPCIILGCFLHQTLFGPISSLSTHSDCCFKQCWHYITVNMVQINRWFFIK